MRTCCSHCGQHFKVPDKTLGKQAKCRECGQMFVITPAAEREDVAMKQVDAPRRERSAPKPQPASSDDPLDALADAAFESGSHMRPAHASTHGASRAYGDEDYGPRRRTARGAKLAMAMGITATACAVIGGVFAVIMMVNSDDQSLMVVLGLISIALLAIAAITGMMAVSNGTSAGKQIRKARHPLGGRSEASTGMLMGWIALGLVLIAVVAGAIWMSRNPDVLTFKKEVDAQGEP